MCWRFDWPVNGTVEGEKVIAGGAGAGVLDLWKELNNEATEASDEHIPVDSGRWRTVTADPGVRCSFSVS